MPLPRIRYSVDGTLGWVILPESTKEAISSANMYILDGDLWKSDYTSVGGTYWPKNLVFNFPDTVRLDSIKLKLNITQNNINFKISTDSTDGIDGSWSTLLTDNYDYAYEYQNFSLTPTDARWLQITQGAGFTNALFFALHLFGEYQTPLFEIWNTGESAKLNTVTYPISLSDASNATDYSEYFAFKLKNVDASQHDYSLNVDSIRYGGQPIITTNIQLSTDSGVSKLNTVTVSSLGAGNFSSEIRIYGDFIKADNPANGKSYYCLKITQTA